MPRFLSALNALIFFSLATSSQGFAQQFFDDRPFGTVNRGDSQSSIGLEIYVGSNDLILLSSYPKDHLGRILSRAVGRLDIERNSGVVGTCTATLIERSTIITNYHCIPGYDSTVGKHGAATRAQLVLDYYSQDDTLAAIKIPVSVTPVDSSPELDFSVLKLTSPAPNDIATLGLPIAPATDREALLIFHHPRGWPKMLSAKNCSAGSPSTDVDGQFIHLCDTQPGSSGALILNANGTHLVAIHHSGDSLNELNYGTTMESIVEKSVFLAQLFPDQTGTAEPPIVTSPNSRDKRSAKDQCLSVVYVGSHWGDNRPFVEKPSEVLEVCREAQNSQLSESERNTVMSTLAYAHASLLQFDTAEDLLDTACSSGSSSACRSLGNYFQFQVGGLRGWVSAGASYEKGCDLGSGRACQALANLFRDKAIDSNGSKYNQRNANLRSCDLGYDPGCYELAKTLDRAEAIPIYQELCG